MLAAWNCAACCLYLLLSRTLYTEPIMKYFYLTIGLLWALGVNNAFAQEHAGLKRLDLDTAMAPFYHGVASGDPLNDAVIIWTRVTTEDTSLTSFPVHWEMASDTGFAAIVDSGTVTTDAAKDYTVKVDVTGLEPYTWYYYRFKYDSVYSVTGRTKTAPDSLVCQLRFGVVSCSDYKNGYFNAYGHLAGRNDLDAVIHLGDYIYEYATSSSSVRGHEPPNEIVSLSDYRGRFSHYKLDDDLRALHQMYPFITIWDDHETANNSWVGGAQNHSPSTEGSWADRKDNAMTAYFEWMPIRDPQGANPFKGYREISYGELADIYVLDTRLDGRDEETSNSSTINDPNRTLIGTDQMNWLLNGLSDTTSRWKIIAQQVMMAPLALGGTPLNPDQWDGYPADRGRIYDHILDNNIENVVVLTGDIHTAWANNLEQDGDAVAVEFVTTSITSSSDAVPSFVDEGIIMGALSHVEYVELRDKGYYILDLTMDTAQANFYYVNTITSPDTSAYFDAAWFVTAGNRSLEEGSESFLHDVDSCNLAPEPITAINSPGKPEKLLIIGAYPNPFNSELLIQYHSASSENIKLELYDLMGKRVLEQTLTNTGGVNYTKINGAGLPAGHYILTMTEGDQVYKRRVVKGE